MPDITEIISLLDELRGKWNKLLEDGKAEPEWKQKVTINFTDKFNSKELCGLDLKVAEFLGDVLAAIPKLFDEHDILRQAALDGERYRKAGAELANAIESMNIEEENGLCTDGHEVSKLEDLECKACLRYVECQNICSYWRDMCKKALFIYRQAVEQKEV